jgi:hypothetical protein
MASTKRPFGLQPIRKMGAAPNSGGYNKYRMGVSSADAVCRNDPVAMVSGVVQRLSGTRPFGVAAQFMWVDPTSKLPVWQDYIPAGTSSFDSNVWVLVADDAQLTFAIQADATVSNGDIGFNFDLSGVGSADPYIGLSQAVLKKSTRTSGAATVRVLNVRDIVGNVVDDAFTIVEVQFINPQQFTTSVS